MTRMRRPHLLLATGTLAALAVAAEFALRLAAPVADPTRSTAQHVSAANPYIRFEYPRGYASVTEAEAGLPGVQGRNSFTTNRYGLRGDSLAVPKPPQECRIFVVGGSTAECFYLDDADDLARVVQDELEAKSGGAVRVYNAGLSGSATDDHIALLAQRLVHLEPDVVVVLAGVNDLRRSIQGFDYLHYVSSDGARERSWLRHMLLSSQIVRRLVYLSRRVDPDPDSVLETRTLKSDYARKIALQRSARATEADVRVDTAGYQRNLRSLVGIARAHQFRLVFATHPSSWNSKVDPAARERHWMRVYDGVVYREDVMDAALERLNDVVRVVAAEDSVPLYDLARELPKSLEFFYDDCHFTRAGALAAGRGLARFLAEHALVPLRASRVAQEGGVE